MSLYSTRHCRCTLHLELSSILSWGILTSAISHADPPVSHAEEDSFAAEVAALLPPAPIAPPAPPPLMTQRIVLGDWSGIIPWTPHIPVSVATLPNGRILTFASNERTTFPNGPEFTYAATWDPATGEFEEYNHPSHDMFCGGLALLPDGRLLVNGGRSVTVLSSLFDWRDNTWTPIAEMNDQRWYNTTVALPNGQAFTASGSGGSSTTELWDESVGWSRLPGIDWRVVLREPGYINIWHPFLLLAPNGRIIHFGPTRSMHWILPASSGSLVDAGVQVPGTLYPKEGIWAVYDEAKILVAGGGVSTTQNPNDSTTGISSSSAFTIDLGTDPPRVSSAASMSFARQFANSVILPTGEVMVLGGNTSGRKFNDAGSILTPEIWNPSTGKWRVAADASVPRNYHSFALLLPDGRVLSGGGGLSGNSADHQDAQIYTPPNLFRSDGGLAARPTLDAVPSKIGVATTFTVTGSPDIKRFSFIKLSAMTHSVNTDLRFLSIPFSEISPGVYHLTARSNLNVMPPGYWMLFGLDAAGVHSVSKIVQVDPNPAVHIAAVGSQASFIGEPIRLALEGRGPEGSVLSWSASGLPAGLTLDSRSGLLSGAPLATASTRVTVTLTDGNTSDTTTFFWSVEPFNLTRDIRDFSSVTGLTFNGSAAVIDSVLRLTTNSSLQAGSVYLSSSVPIGPDTSFNTRWVFRIHGTADGADGLTFLIQGQGANALGGTGGNLAYKGIGRSLAVEVDTYQGVGDPNANHLGILENGVTTNHLATWTPTWDLEDEQSHTVWVTYDGLAKQLEVYADPGNVNQRPALPVMSVSVDLPSIVGSEAWIGFSGATGRLTDNHEIQEWSLTVNALAPPSQPILLQPSPVFTVIGFPSALQLTASDANGDVLRWSASGLPPGLSIAPDSGLISGIPSAGGHYTPIIVVTDGNTLPVEMSFAWDVNPALTLSSLIGPPVPIGSVANLTARALGGVNPRFSWNFGDGTGDTEFSTSPSVVHTFSAPGRFLVVVTAKDDTGRQVTASFRQGVFSPATSASPSMSSSLLYESKSAAGPRLWAANPDNNTVTVFDAQTPRKLTEIPVGRAPRTLALAPDGRVWVVNSESDTVSIVAASLSVAQTLELPRGSRPFGIVFDPTGTRAFIALEFGGRILQLHPLTGDLISSVHVGLHVRHLSINAAGTKLLAARFITPPLPGEHTASPQSSLNGISYGGEVIVLRPSTLAILSTNILHHSEQPDTSNSAHGIPNYLGAAAISPDGLSAWIPSKQDNIKRGLFRSGAPLTHDTTVRSVVSRVIVGTGVEDLAGRVDFDNGGVASAAMFDATGLLLFVALEGSREVGVVDPWAKREILRFSAGRAPQALALSADGSTLFVHNMMDRTVSLHDLSSLRNGRDLPPPSPVVLSCVAQEALAPAVLRGKQLFYDSRDPRLAFQQYLSCASCHNDGGQDGRIWDFAQFGEGLRNTIELRGHGGTAQGPLHWTGNFDEVQDFEGQIRNFALGQGLMNNVDFHFGTRSEPMGDPKAGLSSDLDSLAAYLNSLTNNGISPNRTLNNGLSISAIEGERIFRRLDCGRCHSGKELTDSAIGVAHDIGTLKPTSGRRLGTVLMGLDTPTLRGLWATGPYLHDGSATSVAQAVLAHRGVSVSSVELADLTAYLLQLDDLVVSTPLNAVATVVDAHCGLSDGVVTIVPAGGLGSLQYSQGGVDWQRDPVFRSLAPGNHKFQVRTADGTQALSLDSVVVGEICPSLTLEREGELIFRLSLDVKPEKLSGWVLEASSDLRSWTAVTQANGERPIFSANDQASQMRLARPPGFAKEFFRLRFQSP